MGDVIPLSMSSLCETVEHVHVREITNFEAYPSPEIMFDSMGFGSRPEEFERNGARRADWLNGVFSESVQMVADGMQLDVAEIVSTQELALADEDLRPPPASSAEAASPVNTGGGPASPPRASNGSRTKPYGGCTARSRLNGPPGITPFCSRVHQRCTSSSHPISE